jgi:hypothetical protein
MNAEETNLCPLTEILAMQHEIARSKHEHALHMTLPNQLNSLGNRHHPSLGQPLRPLRHSDQVCTGGCGCRSYNCWTLCYASPNTLTGGQRADP